MNTVICIFDLGCNVGFYGEDCSKKCNHCRNNATCRIQNGECDDLGCSNKGYQPPSCQRKTNYSLTII